MQRGGAWDNSDVKGARKSKWLKSDKDYASGGYKKEQSVSIFGVGEGLDWTGARGRTGPYNQSNNKPKVSKKTSTKSSNENKTERKKLFGLF